MKKRTLFVSVLCIFAALICLVGCQSQKPQENEFPKIAFDKDMVTVTLEENGTTGFTWTYIADPQDALKLESDDFIPANSDEKIGGSGGLHEFRLRAQKPGEITLTFNYARSWEDVEPEKTVTYQLKIDDQLNVTMKQ